MKPSYKTFIFLILIFLLSFSLRIFGLNWDQNNHLHPDERFLTMLVNDIKLPLSLPQYFDIKSSPLNPYNYDAYQFFVYGTFPVFLVKYLAVFFHLDNYDQITLLGRFLSAIFDASNVFLLYFISKKFLKSFYKFLPPLFYTFLILPLQLSHFFTVDTFLNFFILLTFALLINNLPFLAFFVFGLALACKVSALYFVPMIFLVLVYQKKKILPILKSCLYFLISFLSFRFFQPYSFNGLITPNPAFVDSLKTLVAYSNAGIYYPPGIQWLNRYPLLNSFKNNFFWGMGIFFSLPLFLLIIRSLSKIKFKFNLIFVIFLCSLIFFIVQSLQVVHSLRYLYPIYPFVAIIFAVLLSKFKISRFLTLTLLFLNLVSALAFLSIYSHPHSRVQASAWIFQNISSDKVLSNEYWDDALPLANSNYQSETLTLFDPDTPTKWEKINLSLHRVDYLIMSSNRLWASIPRLPQEYPQSSLFYENLFAQKLDFTKVKEFNSYPGFSLPFLKSCYYFGPSNFPGIENYWFSKDTDCPFPGIYFRDDTAEEAFTVYDHPKVLIFQKK